MGILPIGFFAPLPLAIMIPFMAAQSFAMGHAFGTSFQYGKRKISSMTNEEFNALSATDIHGELQADIRAMIPDMHSSFQRMEQFQIDIINSMVNTLKLAAAQFFEWITTGRVTSGGDTQTDTSATNIDFTGGVFDVQGGSRQDNALTSDNPASNLFRNSAGQTYEEWVKSLGTPAIIQENKRKSALAKRKVLADIEESRKAAKKITPKQILDTSVRPTLPSGKLAQQFKTPAQHAATKAANKIKLQQNLRSAEGTLKLKKLEYKRLYAAWMPRIKKVLAGRIRASVMTAQNQLRTLARLRATIAILLKKQKIQIICKKNAKNTGYKWCISPINH